MAELYALQEILPQVKELGGNIVALTPQKVERTAEQLKKNPIEYDVLTDFENAYANELGIRFEMPDYLIELYQKFGLDFPNFHGVLSEYGWCPAALVYHWQDVGGTWSCCHRMWAMEGPP